MKVAIVMMQKNEVALLRPWVEYHAALVGIENLHVLDNGSTDEHVLSLLDAFAARGMNVIREHRDRQAYATRERIVTDIFHRLSNEGQYDFLFPLDCDEFLAAHDERGEVSVDPQVFFGALQPFRGDPRTLTIAAGYDNVPTHEGLFLPSPTQRKCFFASGQCERLGVGYHVCRAKSSSDSVTTSVVYVHFHNRPYRHYRYAAFEKLTGRVPDFTRETLKRHSEARGEGFHLISGFSMPESEYPRRFQLKRAVAIPTFATRLDQLGAPLVFRDSDVPDVGAAIARIRGYVESARVVDGELRVTGWAIAVDSATPPGEARLVDEMVLMVAKHQIRPVRVERQDRPDVRRAHPEAALGCGFSLAVPIADVPVPLERGQVVAVHARDVVSGLLVPLVCRSTVVTRQSVENTMKQRVRVGVICMQKDEAVLLPSWIEYHGRLFGFESLTVLDNGSTDPACLAVLKSAGERGVSIVNAPGAEAFERKGKLVSALVANATDIDWFIPLDCDEFVVQRDEQGTIRTDSQSILDEFARLDATDKDLARVATQFYNVPFTTGCYEDVARKVIVRAGCSTELDKGFHLHDWGANRSTVPESAFEPTSLAYVHFHNRPFVDLLRRAREKLKLRVPNFRRSTMERYRGDGAHLARYFSMTEEQYLRRLPAPKRSLEDLGVPVPFSVREPSSDAELEEAREPFNVDAYARFSLASEAELRALARSLRGVHHYFEYGAGGTTRVALEYGVQRVDSVDTDFRFCTTLLDSGLRAFVDTRRLMLHHVEVGETGEFGFPRELPSAERVRAYLAKAELAASADLVLVDGRFRVACLAALYPRIRSDVPVLLRDCDRDRYGPVRELYDFTERVGGMAVLRRIPDRDARALEILESSLQDPS